MTTASVTAPLLLGFEPGLAVALASFAVVICGVLALVYLLDRTYVERPPRDRSWTLPNGQPAPTRREPPREPSVPPEDKEPTYLRVRPDGVHIVLSLTPDSSPARGRAAAALQRAWLDLEDEDLRIITALCGGEIGE